MSLNRIHSELEYILQLVRRWQREGGASLIEKEIALHKMRTLYELTSSLDTAAPFAPAPEEELAAEPEVEVELLFDEPAATDDPSTEPEVGTELCSDEPAETDDPSTEPEAGTELCSDEPAAADAERPAASATCEVRPGSTAASEPGTVPGTDFAPAPEPTPVSEPAPAAQSAPSAPEASGQAVRSIVEGALFDVEKEAPRRSRRNALLSLYGDNDRPCRPTPQPALVTPAPEPQPAPLAAAPAPAPQRTVVQEAAPLACAQAEPTPPAVSPAPPTGEPQPQSAGTAASSAPVAEPAPQPLPEPGPQPAESDALSADPSAMELIADEITPSGPEEALRAEQSLPDTELPAFEPDTVFAPSATESDAPAAVLGEVINTDTRTLADTLAAASPQSVTAAERLASLRDGLGLNDKFLIIRDLFDGDGSLYEQAIDELDSFDDLDDAMLCIYDKRWNQNSDSVKLLVELLIRKLA